MLMDDYQAIIGLGCPGYEPFKDSMEVTMKIKNFQCDYMSTVFTDGIFKDLDLSELTKTTNQLNQSAQKLVEGSITRRMYNVWTIPSYIYVQCV